MSRGIILKSTREIGLMREAGAIVAAAHDLARGLITPGIETQEIDEAVEALFIERGAVSLFKGFPGKTPFPAVTCISVNDEIVHGIPGRRVLQVGDIVSVDTGCKLGKWCGDAAWTYAVGEISDDNRRLMDIGVETLREAVRGLATERYWSAIAQRMAKLARGAGFSVVEQFVGHGIGQTMHEPPQVPNYVSGSLKRDDFEIRPGLVLAIEPMINAGRPGVKILNDKWTAVTVDGSSSVHFEHTVAVTSSGPVILTDGVGGAPFTW